MIGQRAGTKVVGKMHTGPINLLPGDQMRMPADVTLPTVGTGIRMMIADDRARRRAGILGPVLDMGTDMKPSHSDAAEAQALSDAAGAQKAMASISPQVWQRCAGCSAPPPG